MTQNKYQNITYLDKYSLYGYAMSLKMQIQMVRSERV